jgi:Flp pilus assembly protein TadD
MKLHLAAHSRAPQIHPTGSPESTHCAANQWRLVVELRSAFERSPHLARQLLDQIPDEDGSITQTVLAAVREAAAHSPEQVELHAAVALLAARVGRWDLVDEYARRGLELDRSHASLWAARLSALMRGGRAGEAMDAMNDAIRMGLSVDRLRAALKDFESLPGIRGGNCHGLSS